MRRLLSILCFLLAFSASAFALQASAGELLPPGRSVGFTASPVFSLVNGRSYELVMASAGSDTPYLSKLVWELNNTVNLGAAVSVNMGNLLFFNLAAAKSLTYKTGEMNDYDWLYDSYPDADTTTWTNWSLSDIYLKDSYQIDYNTSLRVFRNYRFSLDGLAGFKLIHWAWTDILQDIDYPYSSYDPSYLTGENGIDYEVNYRIPYTGLRLSAEKDAIQGSLTMIYSSMVSADDYDHHLFRDLHFYDFFENGRFFGLTAGIRYRTSRHFSLSLSYEWEEVFETVGDVYILRETDSGFIRYAPDIGGAGIRYTASTVSAALEFSY